MKDAARVRESSETAVFRSVNLVSGLSARLTIAPNLLHTFCGTTFLPSLPKRKKYNPKTICLPHL